MNAANTSYMGKQTSVAAVLLVSECVLCLDITTEATYFIHSVSWRQVSFS